MDEVPMSCVAAAAVDVVVAEIAAEGKVHKSDERGS